uniref:Uncharacterized protein n=1 Tax=Anguilla anguilla TaxID=7936 RepID=A0A0E9WBC6_ANGAN
MPFWLRWKLNEQKKIPDKRRLAAGMAYSVNQKTMM